MVKIRYTSFFSKSFNAYTKWSFIFVALIFNQCSKDIEVPPNPTGRSKTYKIRNTDLSNIEGSVTFIENDNNSTTIEFNLDNTSPDINNTIYLRRQTANIGGGLAATLSPLNGRTGVSTTLLSKLNDGQNISYNQLLDFNGYLALEISDKFTGVIAAYADIGPNEPTGNKVTYSLFSPLDTKQNGLVIFEERKKGTSAVTVNIFDFELNKSYPVFLKDNEFNSSNEVLIELPPVNGDQNGNSFSEIIEIKDVPITFKELITLNATLEVVSNLDDNVIITKGGIGSNPDAKRN